MNRTPGQRFVAQLAARLPGLGGLFLLALIPGLVIGLGLSYAIFQNERTTLQQGSLQTARALLQAVDSDIASVQSLALSLSRSEYLRAGDLAAFYEQAREVIELSGVGFNGVLSDAQGRQLVNTAIPFSSALPEHGNRPHFLQALGADKPMLSNLYQGAVLQRPLVSIDVPVVQEGVPVYVLSIGLLPDHFNSLLVQQNLPSGWIATVLDGADVVVGRNLSPERTVGQSATPDLRAQIAQNRQGVMASQSLEGNPTFIAYAKSNQTGWSIVVGMTQAVLYEDLYDLQILMALGVAAMLGSSLALSWLFSNHMRRSLRALGKATEVSVEQGGPALAPTNSGIREIDQLAGKFNAMQEANRAMEQHIRAMAFQDPLTGLANRRLLLDRLEQSLAANNRSGEFSALIFFDLDNFKPLNDRHGHGAGDELLETVACRLRQGVREHDTVARFGGDEFVVLLTRLGGDGRLAEQAAGAIAEQLRQQLAQPYELQQNGGSGQRAVQHVCTASVGVVVFSNSVRDADVLIDRADNAMYQAKMGGRDRVVIAVH